MTAQAAGAMPRCKKSMRFPLLWIVLLASAIIWIINLQRRLRAAEMRGDMYRDISTRLDRRIAELTAKQLASES